MIRGGFDDKHVAVARHVAQKDFYFFTRWMLLQAKGQQWLKAPHHPLICDALMRVFRLETMRLVINLPPRYSKTVFVQNFVAWALGQCPDSEFIYTSYSAELAETNSWETRGLVESEEYRAIYPDVKLRSDAAARHHWRTTAGGVVYASGTYGTITGFGAGKLRDGFGGAIFIDDPHKPAEVGGPEREKVLSWYTNTLRSRRNSDHTPTVVIMQRLHDQDLAGWLLDGGDGEKWESLVVPAIQDDGSALWPEKHSIEDLRRMQESDRYNFAGQYMQQPYPLEGGFFALRDFLVTDNPTAEQPEYLPVEPHKRPQCVVAFIDTASKTGKEHDGIGVVYASYSPLHGIPLTILDWELTQIDAAFQTDWIPSVFQRCEELAREVEALMGSIGAFIEDKDAGMMLLQHAPGKGWPLHGIDSKLTALGKVGRALSVSGYIHGGKVKISRHAYEKRTLFKGAMRNHLLSQLLAFSPDVKDQGQDDLLDAATYSVAVCLGNNAGF